MTKPETLVTLTMCNAGTCPTVYLADDGMLVVQGYTTSLETPDGESAVRIPSSVILEAVSQLALR